LGAQKGHSGNSSDCGGTKKLIAIITDYAAADRIINDLRTMFVDEKPLPSGVFTVVVLIAAEERAEYFRGQRFHEREKSCVFRAIFRSTVTMIRPDGPLRSHSLVLDFDLRPGVSFFRDERY
jgi:hypothetical protein